VGVKKGDLDALEMEEGKFFPSITIMNQGDNVCWEVSNVYGPIQYEKKGEFL
jgi:hypothetical protein